MNIEASFANKSNDYQISKSNFCSVNNAKQQNMLPNAAKTPNHQVVRQNHQNTTIIVIIQWLVFDYLFIHNILPLIDMDLRIIVTALLIAVTSNQCLIYVQLNQCSQCQQGSYLSTNYECLPCPLGCSQCLSNNYCVSCYSNFYLINYSCQVGPQNCLQVNSNGACTQCILGYYLNQTQCLPCPNFCINCNSTQCLNCSIGFGLYLNNNTCYACGGICSQCQYQTSNLCLQCPLGYYSQNQLCLQCQPNCLQCSQSPQNCSTCALGYFLQATQCSLCASNCINCNSLTNCTICKAGFFILNQTSEQICQTCPNLCITCISSTVCSSCNNGYYLQSGTCTRCGIACSLCLGINQCLICQGSYYNNNGVCEQCPTLCASCSSSQFCLSCNSNSYAPSLGECVLCSSIITGCLTCSSSLVCLTCENSYDLVDGSCIYEKQSLSGGMIALIVICSLIVASGIGVGIYCFWKKRRGFMGPEESSRGTGLKETYYQIP